MRPKLKDRHLPKCVYLKHGTYWYVKQRKWKKLADNLQDALIAYACIIAPREGLLPDLIDRALPSLIENKRESTKKQYLACANLLKEIFAEFAPDEVRHGDVVQMMDFYKSNYSIGNRNLTVLRLVYQWALDRGIVQVNPTVSVKRHPQRSRDRLITHEEYAKIHAQCAPWLKDIIDVCYYTGQRIGDVLSIKYEQLQEDGIYFKQQKTGNRLIVGWTQELMDIVASAKYLHRKKINNQYLFPSRSSQTLKHSNVWRCFKNACLLAEVDNVTLHDIRAMAGTEAQKQGINPTKLLGHTSARTTQIYLRDKSASVVQSPKKK